MKNLIRGVLLGLALGAALHWLGTMPGYFPSVLAVVVLHSVHPFVSWAGAQPRW